MLVVPKAGGPVQDELFIDFPNHLVSGDVLVLNNTRVTALRLFGNKPTGAKIEVLLLRQLAEANTFCALVKPAKRLRVGSRIIFGTNLGATIVEELDGGLRSLTFDAIPNLSEALQEAGQVPLPPYIAEKLRDPERYQTIFAEQPGSSAAPTASLHFTKWLLDEIMAKGVQVAYVTLDVGIDTFRPIEVETAEAHQMHGETCRITAKAANLMNERSGRLIPVGTTAVRTIESFADESGEIRSGEQSTRLFIKPGYEWRAVDGMLTNFHLPRTTMMMMVSALASREQVMTAYAHAIRSQYRFLSFGDAMLII